MITIENTQNLLNELKTYKDLKYVKEHLNEFFCNKYGITSGELSFMIAVAIAENIKEDYYTI